MITNSLNLVPFPQIPEWRGIAFVALSVLIMAFSHLFGPIAILLFFAVWFSHIFYQKIFILRPSTPIVLAGLFPFLCMFSLFWSDYLFESAYKGAEFFSLFFCTLIMARIVTIEAFIRGVIVGILMILLITLASGHYTISGINGEAALTGFSGSKNIIGLYSTLGILCSFIFLLGKTSFKEKLLYVPIPTLLCLLTLVLSKSASSLVAVIITIAIFIGMRLISYLPRGLQAVSICLVLASISVVFLFQYAFDISLYAEALKALGKNPNLTGRTDLWLFGINFGLKQPFLGHGYAAFWVPGQPDAEILWAQFYISSRSGFHFHNLYVETFVELGILGLILVCLLILGAALKSTIMLLNDPTDFTACVSFCLLTLFIVRSFVEVDLLGPFGMGVLLFYSCLFYLFDKQKPPS